ncbi:hypothetical protein ACFQU7_17825 [Pseudoroseomonas wenyumeiae]
MIHYMQDTPDSQKRRCLIVLSHSLNEVTLARFRQCQAELASTFDVFLVLSEPLQDEAKKHGLQNVVCPTRAQIFPPEYGRKSATFSIKPGNADLILLAFWRQHPGYEYYWVMEFDVYTPRGLSQLAELDRGSDADLLGTYIRLRRHHASWDNWGAWKQGHRRWKAWMSTWWRPPASCPCPAIRHGCWLPWTGATSGAGSATMRPPSRPWPPAME